MSTPEPKRHLDSEEGRPLNPALSALARSHLGHLPADFRLRPIKQRRPLLTWAFVAVAASAAAWFLVARKTDELTVQASGGRFEQGLLEAQERPGRLAFSDGSKVHLSAHGSVRVDTIDKTGALLRLQGGQADLDIVPNPQGRWAIAAGPYRITVKGTVFQVNWDEKHARVDVAVTRGRVAVEGPGVAGIVELSAGQTFTNEATEKTAPAPAVAAPAAPVIEAPPEKKAPPVARGKAVETVHWAEQIRAGAFAAVVAEAEERQLDRVLAIATGADLVALADAARYVRRDDVARASYLALRRRFRGSLWAQDSAFHLGRIEDGREGPTLGALHWYQTYLKESPSGSFAAEALGRELRARLKLEGAAQSRPAAERYLQLYPAGAFADLARQIIGP